MIGSRFIAMTGSEFAFIEAGQFTMGSNQAPHPEDGEEPAREVFVDAFRIATAALSVREFAQFIAATAYITAAERMGSSHVFFAHLTNPDEYDMPLADAPWWRDVPGACWHRPNGRDEALADHPVVHVSHEDALAYCAWRGVRLPTEAEWERAAQGGEDLRLNIWSGRFPDAPMGTPGTCAVRDGKPNENGLYHSCGNVWEWTADGFGRLHSPRPARNPGGNLRASNKVVKGGSYLCAPSYCARFHPSSRRPEAPNATTGHVGFRVAAL